jgi:aminoglycoside phosphotransferase family enzyme/predicted kinase
MAADDDRMEPLEAGLVAFLATPEAYPDDPSAKRGVRHIQTHLSHVYLTAERVYKLHKPVRFGFVDFSTRAERSADSLRELHLNRRLAPDVYLGVAPVGRRRGAFRLGALGEGLETTAGDAPDAEHLVVMRRLPDGGDALALLERGSLRESHVDAIASRIADFHARNGMGAPAPIAPEAWLARVLGPVRESFGDVGRSDPFGARAHAAGARAEALLARHAQRFERRRASGRVVDGHGDLHLAHVWFERDDAEPLVIDCLEFRDDYRQIDAASEVAFLAMDLEYRGRRDLGERFLRRYAEASDDYDLYGVVDFFFAYRAAVRAKVACLAALDEAVPKPQREAAARSAEQHLALAEAALEEPRRGAVVAMAGIVGSGKSSVAQALADATGGVVIASDRVRKRQAALPAGARGHVELYTDERTEATYAGLLERAAPVVLSGRVAILDATYARVNFRRELCAWAAAHALRAFLVESSCPEPIARARLEARAREGRDPSDAGPELYASSAAGFQPPDEFPVDARALVRTDDPHWRAAVADVAKRFALGEPVARAACRADAR